MSHGTTLKFVSCPFLETFHFVSLALREQCPNTKFFLVRIFPYPDWYEVSLRIHSECGKIRTRKTPHLDTFHAVLVPFTNRRLFFELLSYKALWMETSSEHSWGIKERRSRPKVFCRKGVLRNFTKFTRKHLCHSLFFNKVAGLRLFFELLPYKPLWMETTSEYS